MMKREVTRGERGKDIPEYIHSSQWCAIKERKGGGKKKRKGA